MSVIVKYRVKGIYRVRELLRKATTEKKALDRVVKQLTRQMRRLIQETSPER